MSEFQRNQRNFNGIDLARWLHAPNKSGGELVSPGMWILLNLYRNVFVKFSILPFSFTLSDRLIRVDRLTRGKRLVSKCLSVLGPIHSLICFYLLRNIIYGRGEDAKLKGDDVFNILRPVAVIYLGLVPPSLMGMSYAISFCPEVAPSIVNCILRFEKKFFGPIAIIALVPPAIVMNVDPLSIWFSTLCEDCTTRKVAFYTVRSLILTMISAEIAKAGLAFLIIGLIVIFAVAEATEKLDNYIKWITASPTVSKLEMVRLYQELQIWNQHTNASFCYSAIPPLLFFGVATNIFANYATIKLYGVVPNMLYPVAPWTSLLGGIFLMTLLPLAAKTYENSSRFLTWVKGHLIDKYDRRVTYSLRPIGAQCGPFGVITNSWMSRLVDTILNYTATALLTF
ncbi:hypothetical protein Fcan01_18852 [Folsomia candida]|uniref:Uncharacterized protein n=1 Tax=Folsomia candida TaxID=158441 RepID=A0A226DM19_FOLCA|nr:hypothetical protein Fcan01_18852 [Folsomia candida]